MSRATKRAAAFVVWSGLATAAAFVLSSPYGLPFAFAGLGLGIKGLVVLWRDDLQP